MFLFDEPLSNLDAKLRTEMRVELKRLHKELGATIIYVTHDQIEAMTLATRIAVMRAGRIEQYAAPDELYEVPETLFVAELRRFAGDELHARTSDNRRRSGRIRQRCRSMAIASVRHPPPDRT